MRVATRSRKVRSWVMVTTLPLKSISRFSSHSMESRSRWLVGSSSSSTSGRRTSACASATRLLVAAGKRADAASLSRCSRCRVSSTRCSQFQPSCASMRALQRVEVAVAVAVLVDQRDHVGQPGAGGVEHVGVHDPAAAPARHRRCAGPAAAAASPSSGFSRPARIFSSEDLPAPLRPIRPTRSPLRARSRRGRAARRGRRRAAR